MLPLLVAAALGAAPVQAAGDASACRLNQSTDFLRDLLFGAASREPNAEQGTLTDLKRASKVDLGQARVIAYDAKSGRIECMGQVEVTVPAEAAPAFGGKARLTVPVRFTAEPSSDGHGFMIFASRMAPLTGQLAKASKELGPTRLTPIAASAPATDPVEDMLKRAAENLSEPKAETKPIKVAEAKPAFDCALAATEVELMLCGDAELAERDRRVASQYFSLRGSLPAKLRTQLLQSQRLFLKQRASCSTGTCLSDLYDQRLRRLEQFGQSRAK